MAGLGAGIRSVPSTLPDIILALLTGLNASAVGLIAVAAYQLSTNAVTDDLTRLIVLGSASFGITYHAPWVSSHQHMLDFKALPMMSASALYCPHA